jgi:hypothetical protein
VLPVGLREGHCLVLERHGDFGAEAISFAEKECNPPPGWSFIGLTRQEAHMSSIDQDIKSAAATTCVAAVIAFVLAIVIATG